MSIGSTANRVLRHSLSMAKRLKPPSSPKSSVAAPQIAQQQGLSDRLDALRCSNLGDQPEDLAKAASLLEGGLYWFNQLHHHPYETEPKDRFLEKTAEEIETTKLNCVGFVLQCMVLCEMISPESALDIPNLYLFAGVWSESAKPVDQNPESYPEPGKLVSFVRNSRPTEPVHITVSLGDGYLAGLWNEPHHHVHIGHVRDYSSFSLVSSTPMQLVENASDHQVDTDIDYTSYYPIIHQEKIHENLVFIGTTKSLELISLPEMHLVHEWETRGDDEILCWTLSADKRSASYQTAAGEFSIQML